MTLAVDSTGVSSTDLFTTVSLVQGFDSTLLFVTLGRMKSVMRTVFLLLGNHILYRSATFLSNYIGSSALSSSFFLNFNALTDFPFVPQENNVAGFGTFAPGQSLSM